jgi:hypothetical protein
MAGRNARFCLPAFVALAALGAGGCGSSGIGGTIPTTNAATLQADLNEVQAALSAQDCASATAAIDSFTADVNNLPESAGVELKDDLRTLSGRLQSQIQGELDCSTPPPAGATGATGFQPPTTSSTTASATSTSSTPSPPPPPRAGPGNSGNAPGHAGTPPGQQNGGTGGVGPGDGNE